MSPVRSAKERIGVRRAKAGSGVDTKWYPNGDFWQGSMSKSGGKYRRLHKLLTGIGLRDNLDAGWSVAMAGSDFRHLRQFVISVFDNNYHAL
jgi:hypothetical protein